jgi:hypothetical protein
VAASSSGSRSPLRTGGIALLGVGIVAATIGLLTSVTGGDGGAPAPTSVQAQPTAGESAVPAPSAEPAPTAPAVPAVPSAPVVPPAAESAAPQPAPSEPAVAAPAPQPDPPAPARQAGEGAREPLRVYNNSLIRGLAAQAESDFKGAGWTVTEASNYSGGTIPRSTVYFRPGTGEEAAARNLAEQFGLRVEPRFNGLGGATPGVIVIVTNDYRPGRKSQ